MFADCAVQKKKPLSPLDRICPSAHVSRIPLLENHCERIAFWHLHRECSPGLTWHDMAQYYQRDHAFAHFAHWLVYGITHVWCPFLARIVHHGTLLSP